MNKYTYICIYRYVYMYVSHENRVVVETEAGSYVRVIHFCITQRKAQGPSRFCNESRKEEEDKEPCVRTFVLEVFL